MTKLHALVAALPILAIPLPAPAAGPPGTGSGLRPSPIEVAHARALDLFRRARFSEAYGRFIELAAMGHPASARHAMWMCENGTALFGVPWDCAAHELEEWRAIVNSPARLGGSPMPVRSR
jgi:hypothetical protein